MTEKRLFRGMKMPQDYFDLKGMRVEQTFTSTT